MALRCISILFRRCYLVTLSGQVIAPYLIRLANRPALAILFGIAGMVWVSMRPACAG